MTYVIPSDDAPAGRQNELTGDLLEASAIYRTVTVQLCNVREVT